MMDARDNRVIELARATAVDMAGNPDQVGDAQTPVEIETNVFEYRFAVIRKGYEGWFWSITLYCDQEQDRWTINESTMLPSDEALVSPAWVPWKDRLRPKDISVTDRLGTDPQDSRMESSEPNPPLAPEGEEHHQDKALSSSVDADDDIAHADQPLEENVQIDNRHLQDDKEDIDVDFLTAIQLQQVARKHVMSPQGKSDTAQRWYAGPNGPKSLSTMTAKGNHCSACAFFVPLQGQLGTMFGACANRWSPDDGRVVSLDHGCGEHSEIEPPAPSTLWIQSSPAYDDLYIDIIEQRSRDELAQVEMIEESVSRRTRRRAARKASSGEAGSDNTHKL